MSWKMLMFFIIHLIRINILNEYIELDVHLAILHLKGFLRDTSFKDGNVMVNRAEHPL